MNAVQTTNPEVASTIDVGGIATNYHDVGEGDPVLLIHGSGPGVSAWANGQSSVALGAGSRATEANVVSVGNGTGAGGHPATRRIVNVADGVDANDAVNVGQLDAVADVAEGTARYFKATGEGEAFVTGEEAVAAGSNAAADGDYSTAVGSSALALEQGASAFGSGAFALETNATAIGFNASASAANALALGALAEAAGEYSIALGAESLASGELSTATGAGAVATGDGSLASGALADASGIEATAVGFFADASGEDRWSPATGSAADPYGQAPGSDPYGQASPYGQGSPYGAPAGAQGFPQDGAQGAGHAAQPGAAPVQGEAQSRVLVGVLGIFFGAFGVHRFLMGYTAIGLVQVLVTVLSCFTLSPITTIWGLVEGIMVLAKSPSFERDAHGRPLRD